MMYGQSRNCYSQGDGLNRRRVSSRGARYNFSPGRRGNNNGCRSPNSYYERTTTVRFIRASDGKPVCTKLNRVQRTLAKLENGACICENFLRGHCDYGAECFLAHVPKQYMWDYLPIPQFNRETMTYAEGFHIRCYAPDMSAYYDIPSECIYVTRGSQSYVELYNDNGDNFREKFTLCGELQESGCCQRGAECEQIHCCYADLSSFSCIRTHIADAEAVKHYECLPTDVVVRVFQPNSGDDGEDFPGADVLRTVGAGQYEAAYRKEGGVPNLKMQHCAHFQNKKLCRMGDGCRFLHVISVALASPNIEDDTTNVSQNISPRSTSLTSPLENNPQARSAKNNIANMLARGMKESSGASINAAGDSYYANLSIPVLNSPATSKELAPRSADVISPIRRNDPYGTYHP